MGRALVSVLASFLRASNHDPSHGGRCWVVSSSSWVLFFDTVGPWCLSSSLSSALGLALVWVLPSSSL